MPYTYLLHSHKTVIQYIYDAHYEGAKTAAHYVAEWRKLRGRVDESRFPDVLAQLEYQAGQAQVWRDAVTNWFQRESAIADEHGRVGRDPGRVEAESMELEGYVVTAVAPWEAASAGQAVTCPAAKCAATFRYDGPVGWYDLRVEYFDQNNGVSRFRLLNGDQLLHEWPAAANLPTNKIDGSSATRRSVSGIALRPGDRIRIEATSDAGERAALDYVEIVPAEN